VNVLGQVAVTKAMLSLIRAARGRIVFMGSISGKIATMMLGPYSASKFALEAIGESLRHELHPWGHQRLGHRARGHQDRNLGEGPPRG